MKVRSVESLRVSAALISLFNLCKMLKHCLLHICNLMGLRRSNELSKLEGLNCSLLSTKFLLGNLNFVYRKIQVSTFTV